MSRPIFRPKLENRALLQFMPIGFMPDHDAKYAYSHIYANVRMKHKIIYAFSIVASIVCLKI